MSEISTQSRAPVNIGVVGEEFAVSKDSMEMFGVIDLETSFDGCRFAIGIHERYFTPEHQEFESRTMWSLSNAFTWAFKELDPIPQFRATAKLGRFLEAASTA